MIKIKNDKIIVNFGGYFPNKINALKNTIPSRERKFNWETKDWEIELNIENGKKIIDFAKDYDIGISEDVAAYVKKAEEEMAVAIDESKSTDADINITGLNGELRPFQKAGVNYIINKKNVIVADEMGLGKTIQAISAIHHEDAYPALIICPASIKYNWQNEFQALSYNKQHNY